MLALVAVVVVIVGTVRCVCAMRYSSCGIIFLLMILYAAATAGTQSQIKTAEPQLSDCQLCVTDARFSLSLCVCNILQWRAAELRRPEVGWCENLYSHLWGKDGQANVAI